MTSAHTYIYKIDLTTMLGGVTRTRTGQKDVQEFLSTDPLAPDFPHYTPYQFAGNSPIENIDLDGLEEYSIHLRKFAPFDWFGIGFKGDGYGRGFSTNPEAKSKLSTITTFDIEKETIVSSIGLSTISVGGYGLWDAISDSQVESSFTDAGRLQIKSYAGNDAAIPFMDTDFTTAVSGDIDFNGDFQIRQGEGLLNISGRISGDQFPSGEAYITDDLGTSIFLGTFAVGDYAAGAYAATAPYVMLLGEGDSPEIEVSITIAVDDAGNFQGVFDLETSETISVDEWNRKFEERDTVRETGMGTATPTPGGGAITPNSNP